MTRVKVDDLPLNEEGKVEVNSGYSFDGKEIVLGRRKGRPPKIRNPKWYSQDKKVQACTLYAVYGSLEEVARLTDVPIAHLRLWKQEPWWIEIIKQVYVEQNENLSARISAVLDKALTELTDRLEHGDMVVSASGKLINKPIEARVLNSMVDSLVHRRQVVRGEPTSISAHIGVDDRLDKLAEAFKRFAAARDVSPELLEREDAQTDS